MVYRHGVFFYNSMLIYSFKSYHFSNFPNQKIFRTFGLKYLVKTLLHLPHVCDSGY
jgi:phosphoglycerol transferase MdoB-like AlkP superfamily enzyme